MTIIRTALLAATLGLAASTPALAQSAEPSPSRQHNCLLTTLNACKADGSCAALDSLRGAKLPIKVTVDLAAGIVAGVDPDGWVDATRIVSVARSADQLILQGVDGAVAWHVLIHEKTEAMSVALATADGTTVGFGQCTAVKEP
jgi:hypothetical protein